MKPIPLFATLSIVLATPCQSAQTELERLRQLCQQQEQQIRHLESQLKQPGGNPASQATSGVATSGSRSNEAGRPTTNDTYIVKAGDHVEKIARHHGCSTSTLNKLNGLNPSSIIHPGQRIKLPAKTQSAATQAQNPTIPLASTASTKSSETLRFHKIKQGETYSSISHKYKIPVSTLIALNPRIEATALRPGINIRLNNGSPNAVTNKQSSLATTDHKAKALAASHSTTIATTQKPTTLAPSPATSPPAAKNETAIASSQAPKKESPPLAEATAADPGPSKTATPAERLAAATPAADPPSGSQADSKVERKIQSVKIDEPMTYGQFAAKYGTDAERLNDLNGLDLTQATVLAKGSELYVPAQP